MNIIYQLALAIPLVFSLYCANFVSVRVGIDSSIDHSFWVYNVYSFCPERRFLPWSACRLKRTQIATPATRQFVSSFSLGINIQSKFVEVLTPLPAYQIRQELL
jgi:hypothetical protein